MVCWPITGQRQVRSFAKSLHLALQSPTAASLDTTMEAAAEAAEARSGEHVHPALRISHPPRFDLSSDESRSAFLKYLHEHGYAVVAAVADEAEVAAAKARFWAAARLSAEDALNPDAPDCDTIWWPHAATGILTPLLRLKCRLTCSCMGFMLNGCTQASPAGPPSTTATSAGQLDCFLASTTLFPLCDFASSTARPCISCTSGVGRRARTHRVLRRRQRVSTMEN